MASMNKVMLIGNLGRDPESRTLPNGSPVSNLSIATSMSFKDKAGGMQKRTEWHKVVLFGRLSEIASEYLKKGDPVYIEGSLRTRKWEGSDGKQNYTTEVVGSVLQLLSKKDATKDAVADDSIDESDIPF